ASVALFGGRSEYLAVNGKHDPSRVGREVEVVGRRSEIAHLSDVVLSLSGDVQSYRRSFLACDVEFPDAEIVFKDDDLSVGADCGESNVSSLERGHALSLSSGFRYAPDVGQAIAFAITDKVNEPVAGPHRPRVDAIVVGNGGEFLCPDVHHRHICVHRPVVVLAPVDLTLSIDRQLCSVRGEAGAYSHVRSDVALDAAVHRDGVEPRHKVVAAI